MGGHDCTKKKKRCCRMEGNSLVSFFMYFFLNLCCHVVTDGVSPRPSYSDEHR